MPATRDPILMLEPSDLLEPLTFEHRQVEGVTRSTLVDPASVPPPRSMRTRQAPAAAATSRRWGLKSALIGMGALACVGAGTALSEFTGLRLGGFVHSPPADSAMRSPAPTVDAPVASAASKPAEPQSNAPASTVSSRDETTGTRGGASPTPSRPEQDKSVQDKPVVDKPAVDKPVVGASPVPAKAAADTGAAACNQSGRPDDANCLAGGVPAPAAAPTRPVVADRNTDDSAPPRPRSAAPPATSQQADPQRAESASRNGSRRAAQRDAAEQQAAVDENASTTSSVATSSGDRRPDRESNRESSRRRDRGARDGSRSASYWDRGQDEDDDRASDRTSERSYGRRGNRYDEGRGAGDRRVGRASREDEGTMVRGPRFGGPLGLFSFGFGRGW